MLPAFFSLLLLLIFAPCFSAKAQALTLSAKPSIQGVFENNHASFQLAYNRTTGNNVQTTIAYDDGWSDVAYGDSVSGLKHKWSLEAGDANPTTKTLTVTGQVIDSLSNPIAGETTSATVNVLVYKTPTELGQQLDLEEVVGNSNYQLIDNIAPGIDSIKTAYNNAPAQNNSTETLVLRANPGVHIFSSGYDFTRLVTIIPKNRISGDILDSNQPIYDSAGTLGESTVIQGRFALSAENSKVSDIILAPLGANPSQITLSANNCTIDHIVSGGLLTTVRIDNTLTTATIKNSRFDEIPAGGYGVDIPFLDVGGSRYGIVVQDVLVRQLGYEQLTSDLLQAGRANATTDAIGIRSDNPVTISGLRAYTPVIMEIYAPSGINPFLNTYIDAGIDPASGLTQAEVAANIDGRLTYRSVPAGIVPQSKLSLEGRTNELTERVINATKKSSPSIGSVRQNASPSYIMVPSKGTKNFIKGGRTIVGNQFYVPQVTYSNAAAQNWEKYDAPVN